MVDKEHILKLLGEMYDAAYYEGYYTYSFELSDNDEKLLSLYSREGDRYLKIKEELLRSIMEE